MTEQVTGLRGTDSLDSLPFQTESLACLGSRRDIECDTVIQGRYLDLTSQCRNTERNRHFAMQIVSFAPENRIGQYPDFDIQITRGPTVLPWFPITGRADSHPIVDTGRNFDFQRFVTPDLAGAMTSRTRLLDDLACSMAGRTRLLDTEKTLLHPDLSLSVTGRTRRRRRTGFRARTMTSLTIIPGRYTNRLGTPSGRFLQRDIHIVAKIGPPIHLRAAASLTASAAEDITENIAKRRIREIRSTRMSPHIHIGIDTGMAETVIRFPFMFIGENLVSFLDFLELFFSGFTIRIAIRMILHRQLAVGFLDLIL